MTYIEYKPHCAKCGVLIDEKVAYQNVIAEGKTIAYHSYSDDTIISPYRCSHCGEMFNRIEIKMPEKDKDIRIK